MKEHLSWPPADKAWTLFLDRDGVINERPHCDYVRHIEAFRWIPGVLESMPVLSEIFGRIIIVTNQQGVGLGLMSSDQLSLIHQHMKQRIRAAGGRIDAIMSCTMLRDEPDNCRKPHLAMAIQAKQKFPEIDFKKSIMVGDTESDIQFGRNAGMITVLIGSETTLTLPDFKQDSLLSFALKLQSACPKY